MRELTQTNINPGNCWQTAIACILDIDPGTMPPQDGIDEDSKVLGSHRSYRNILNAYLTKHHGLTYFELYPHQWPGLLLRRREHLMSGTSKRTADTGRRHCNVGQDGYPIWDTHPSRAGLLTVEHWGVLGPATAGTRESHERLRNGDDEAARLVYGCLCPACGLSEYREAERLFHLTEGATQ